MNKKTQNIIDKCHTLIKKGYSIDYCINKFKGFRQEISDYFTTARHLDMLKEVLPKKEFRENSLDHIISRAEKLENTARMKPMPSTASVRRLILRPAMIFLIFSVLSVFSFAGTLFASQESIPGEALYPLKRSFENFRLNIYPETLKDDLHIQFLKNRIGEADLLLEEENNTGITLMEESIIKIDKQYQICKRNN